MAVFRKVELKIRRAALYGKYVLTGYFKKGEINLYTNDSEIFDWLDDDADPVKHLDAKRKAYKLVCRARNNQ
jgi:hypothetical protein